MPTSDMPTGKDVAAPMADIVDADTLRGRIRRLMIGWSVEATHPKPAEIDHLATTLLPRTRVYLSAVPTVPWERILEHAARIAAAGLEPVPHLAVRNYPGPDAVAEFLERGHEAGVRRVLVVAGDRETPVGTIKDSLQVIGGGLLQAAGMTGVDIAAYPEGHAKIALGHLHGALSAKVHAARVAGLDVGVVTQFSFDAKALLSWVHQVRYEFPHLPLRIGLAGPAHAGTLLKYAMRCGVRATGRGLGRGLSLLGSLSQDRTPARLIRTLAESPAADEKSHVSLHFFAFGGIAKTADWARSVAQGDLNLAGDR